jgi:hypothetical protein
MLMLLVWWVLFGARLWIRTDGVVGRRWRSERAHGCCVDLGLLDTDEGMVSADSLSRRSHLMLPGPSAEDLITVSPG